MNRMGKKQRLASFSLSRKPRSSKMLMWTEFRQAFLSTSSNCKQLLSSIHSGWLGSTAPSGNSSSRGNTPRRRSTALDGLNSRDQFPFFSLCLWISVCNHSGNAARVTAVPHSEASLANRKGEFGTRKSVTDNGTKQTHIKSSNVNSSESLITVLLGRSRWKAS